jgi:hypothetical protein
MTLVAEQVQREHRQSALARMRRELEQEFFLAVSGLADADHGRSPLAGRGRRQEIALQNVSVIGPGNRDDLASRTARGEEAARAFLHGEHRDPAALVGLVQRHRGRAVVVHRPQPVALRGRHVAFRERRLGTLPVGLRQPLPFAVPGLLTALLELPRDHQAFCDGGATLLRRGEEPREFSGNILSLRAEDPVVGEACGYHRSYAL